MKAAVNTSPLVCVFSYSSVDATITYIYLLNGLLQYTHILKVPGFTHRCNRCQNTTILHREFFLERFGVTLYNTKINVIILTQLPSHKSIIQIQALGKCAMFSKFKKSMLWDKNKKHFSSPITFNINRLVIWSKISNYAFFFGVSTVRPQSPNGFGGGGE